VPEEERDARDDTVRRVSKDTTWRGIAGASSRSPPSVRIATSSWGLWTSLACTSVVQHRSIGSLCFRTSNTRVTRSFPDIPDMPVLNSVIGDESGERQPSHAARSHNQMVTSPSQ
jgi:hypothetical protein